MPDATVRLAASPASVTPKFSFGCGRHDGTSSCDLGAVDAKSSQRQLEARAAVAATASSVTSVRLKVTGSAAYLSKDPVVSSTVAVTAAAASPSPSARSTSPSPSTSPSASSTDNGTSAPVPGTSPVPASNLPYLPGVITSPTLSPGGNAASLFPALTPSPDPSGKPGQKANTRTVANTSALPLGAPVVGAQLIGLGVLALAFVLAVSRLSIRRRPALTSAAAASPAAPAAPASSATPAPSATPATPEPQAAPEPPAAESHPEPIPPADEGTPED